MLYLNVKNKLLFYLLFLLFLSKLILSLTCAVAFAQMKMNVSSA